MEGLLACACKKGDHISVLFLFCNYFEDDSAGDAGSLIVQNVPSRLSSVGMSAKREGQAQTLPAHRYFLLDGERPECGERVRGRRNCRLFSRPTDR